MITDTRHRSSTTVHTRGHRNRAVLFALAAVFLGTSVLLADDQGVLIVEADVACAIFIDDDFVFRVEPDTPREAMVEAGTHDVAAFSIQAAGVIWQDIVQVAEEERYELAILLADEVEWELEAEARVPSSDDEWPERFAARDDGIVADLETGLEWTILDNNFDVDWVTSELYCRTLSLAVTVAEGEEERPWRLPTVDELEGLVNDRSYGDFRVLEPLGLSSCCLWSSDGHGSVSAWYMDFSNGRRGFVTRDYTEGGRVLCVRQALPDPEWTLGGR